VLDRDFSYLELLQYCVEAGINPVLDKLMNKSQQHMEQMATLTMIAYAVGLLVGETLRDALYPPPPPADDRPANPAAPSANPLASRCKPSPLSFSHLSQLKSEPQNRGP
jgi:hypothetical protein